MYVFNKMNMQVGAVRTVRKTQTSSCTTLEHTFPVRIHAAPLRMSYVSVRCFFGKVWSCRTYKLKSDVTAFIVTLRGQLI